MKKTNKTALHGGSYSIIITAVALALLIAVNICAAALPTTLTKLDISSTKLYSVTSSTKSIVNNLQKDVTIYWLVQADQEDNVIENLLSKYDSLSTHIDVVKKNPDVYPTFAEQYTSEKVSNNSLIVECGDRYRYIPYSDIYVTEGSVYSYSYSTSFDGEGAITSAIDYVISDELPQVYLLQGHGETDLPSTFSSQLEKDNIETHTLSLLTIDEIPADAACILIYAPQSDISAEERTMLEKYVAAGGKLLVMAGPVDENSLENLYGILYNYGVTVNEGIVIEGDRDHYAFQYPYVLMPEQNSSDITDPLIEANFSPILPLAAGMTVRSSNSSVTTLLSTTASSFSKLAGYSLTTYEQEEDDIAGPFAVAVKIEAENDGGIVWFSCSDFLEDMYNAYSSGANNDLAMNALSALIGNRESVSIRSKSLNYNYLTISDSQGARLKAIMIGILPAMFLGFGVYAVMSTRRKQNETV